MIPGKLSTAAQKTPPERLADRLKGHYTFAAVAAGHDSCGRRLCREERRGLAFAPFVYRLGRHPFTVERAVRFR